MSDAAIPNEFNKKTLFTLSGAAGAVWLVCLVVANLDPQGEVVSGSAYRFIALGLSEFLAIFMIVRDRRKTRRENYLFAFFNGLLIFVNASGINAISSQLSFSNPPSQTEAQNTEPSEAALLAFKLFNNEVDWWRGKNQIQQEQEVIALSNAVTELQVENDSIQTEFKVYQVVQEVEIKKLSQRIEQYKIANPNYNPPQIQDLQISNTIELDPSLTNRVRQQIINNNQVELSPNAINRVIQDLQLTDPSGGQ